MAAPNPPSGGPSANGNGGGASPAPSLLSVSSGTSRISFAIPSATPQKAAAKGAPVNLDTRAALPPKPVAANASLAQAATKGTQASKGIPSLGLPPRPETSWPLNAAGNGSGTVIGGLMRMGSAVAGPGPSTSRETREKGEIKRDRSPSREPGEWSPEQDRRRRSRSRDRDRERERDRRDRDRERERERERDRDHELDRYRRERSRDRERERDRRDHRDRERGRDRDHHLREQRDRDRERDRDRGDRYRNDRYRGSVSPEKRGSYDDERSNGHGRGYAPFSRDRERDREHDRRGDRYTGDLSSRSPVKSPERSQRLARSPVKRARSPVASSAKRRSPSPPKSASKRAPSPSPKGEAKRAPSPLPTSVQRAPSPPPAPPPAPPSDPPPPPSDDIPPPPPEPAADAPPPPPPASPPPPPPPGPKPDLRLPSRPLSATTSLPTTRPTATPPTGPRALTRAPSYGPSAIKAPTASQPAWGPSAANGSAPAWGPKAVPRGPAAWGPNSVAAAPKAPPQPEWKPPPSASRRPGNGNWLMVPDPSDSKTSVKRMDGVHNGVEARVHDPRLKLAPEVRERGAGYMKHRKDGLHTLKYEWDEHSPGPKPPPPPTAVLLTNLNPLTTVDQVSKFLRPYGRIKEIDAKMDTKSGSQLGIVWVRFDGPAPGKTGTAHDVAKNVVKMCDGQRVGMQGGSGGMERVKVVLDGRGLLAEKAVKEEMTRRHAPKPKPPAAATLPSAPTPIASTPSEGKQTPKPSLSRPAPRPPPARGGAKFDTLGRNFSSLNRSLPVGRFQQQRQIPRPGFGVQDFSRDFHGPSQQEAVMNRRFTRGGDLYSPASRSRSRSPPSSSESDSDDDFRRERSPSPRRRARGPARAAVEKKEADEAAVERVRKALASNGKAYVFVDTKSLPSITPEHLVRDHFRAFKPDEVLHNHTGWFVLFSDDQAAYRAQRVLDTTAVQGHRINIDVRTPKGEAAGPTEPEKAAGAGGWRLLTISKNRKAPARQPSPKKMRRKLSVSYTSSDDDEAPRRVARKAVEVKPEPELEDKVVPSPVVKESRVEDVTVEHVEPKVEIEVNDEVVEPKRKRAGKDKPTKTKKARIESPPPVAEVKVAAPPKAKAKPRKKTVVEMVVEAELLADDEDAFWLAQALAHGDDGMELSDAETELDDEHPLYHTSGAWRAEGWCKVAATKKSAYLPQRNRATAAASAAAMPGGTAVLATGRTARVEGRRLALDMESTRKAVSSAQHTEANDVFAFNQLRIRKKQLRFARSAIEGYGLYAMEPIHTGEMVCEYVGELCRVAVSEVREQRYMKQGIGSSYLFRIDGDIVCDATFKGSVSRLVNHSCDPNCLAKIISINGVNKIVLYAKRTIHPGEECLYSYNFALETDPALRVPCLCGSEKCTGFLN